MNDLELNKQEIKEEQLKTMKFKRKQLEDALERFETFIAHIPKLREKPYKDELKMRLRRSETILTQYEAIQGEIEELQFRTESQTRKIFEDSFYRCISRAHKLLDNESESNAISLSIDLPNFDGKYEYWRNFRATFDVLVNKNPSLSNIQRFSYLKSSLCEEAASFLNSLKVSESNYETVWAALEERYENMKDKINADIKGIVDLPKVNSLSRVSCSKQLRLLIDNFSKHLIRLENYLSTDTWDPLLAHIIGSKLDMKTKEDWQVLVANNRELCTTRELIDFLTKRCHAH